MNQKTKALCKDCRNDFYNFRSEQEGCWSFENAKVVTRVKVGSWQNPPYKWQPQSCLLCWHSDAYRMLPEDDPRVTK